MREPHRLPMAPGGRCGYYEKSPQLFSPGDMMSVTMKKVAFGALAVLTLISGIWLDYYLPEPGRDHTFILDVFCSKMAFYIS